MSLTYITCREIGSTIKTHLNAFRELQLQLDTKYESKFDRNPGHDRAFGRARASNGS